MDGVTDLLKKVTDNISDLRIYVITNGVLRNTLGRIDSVDHVSFSNRLKI